MPVDALIVLGIAVATWLFLTKTIHGRRLYAVGDNERAARLSGVPVRLYRAAAYVTCGAFAGLAVRGPVQVPCSDCATSHGSLVATAGAARRAQTKSSIRTSA